MSENKIDKNRLLNAIVNASGSKINKNAIQSAEKGDVSKLIDSLDGQDRQKINQLLSDKEKLKKILASKETRELIKKLSGGGNK